jgi:hypothetical protein
MIMNDGYGVMRMKLSWTILKATISAFMLRYLGNQKKP